MAIKCKVKPDVDGGTHGRLGELKAGSEVEWKEEWGPVPEQVLEIIDTASPGLPAVNADAAQAGAGAEDTTEVNNG